MKGLPVSKSVEVMMYKFVKPGAELPEGAEFVEDDAMEKMLRLHYEAMEWAVANRGAVLYVNAFLPSLQMPAQRAAFYEATEALLETCAADLEDNEPTEARTQLLRVTQTVEIPEEPLVVTPAQAATEKPTTEGKPGGFGLIVPGR